MGKAIINDATVAGTVKLMKLLSMTNQQIEDLFKNALKQKAINLDIYCLAMEEIYGN